MPKRILKGQVTSDSNNKTITVLVERRFTHPVLKKTNKELLFLCSDQGKVTKL